MNTLKAQFEGELCEEQTQKMRKTDQKTTSLKLKSRDPQKVHRGLLLNVHTKFQVPS